MNEGLVRRKSVLNTLNRMDKALDTDRTVETYKELLEECFKVLPTVDAQPVIHSYWIERTDEALRDAMCKMLDKSAEELERMGRKGRELIEDHYSAKTMAEQLFKVYEK